MTPSCWQISTKLTALSITYHNVPLFVVLTETLEKETEKKENFQNWLSDATNNMTMNMKEDEPNQCANQ